MEAEKKKKRKRGGRISNESHSTDRPFLLSAGLTNRTDPSLFSFFFCYIVDRIFILYSLAPSHWRPDVSPLLPYQSQVSTQQKIAVAWGGRILNMFFFLSPTRIKIYIDIFLFKERTKTSVEYVMFI
jgi:hypothetical protein